MDENTTREEYEAPKLWELGSLAELTATDGSSVGDADGTVSDARLKENIETLTRALARLRSIELP
jgi:hypothetical protein